MKRHRQPPRTYRLDEAQLDRIAEDLIPVARALVHAVHHGTRHDVATILGWLNQPVQRVGLTVVLAALVDPDVDPAQALAWLHHPGRDPERRAQLNRSRLEAALSDAARTGPRPATSDTPRLATSDTPRLVHSDTPHVTPSTSDTLPEKGAA